MDIEKLIHCLQCCARVDAHNIGCDDCGLEYCGPECQQLCGTAATALSTLQDENAQLRESRDHWKRLAHELSEGVNGKDAEHERLQAENAQLRAENNMLRRMQPVELNGESARSLSLALETSQLRSELEQVKAERDAAVERIREWEKFDTYLFVHNFITPEKWRGQKED